MLENKIQEELLLARAFGMDVKACMRSALLTGDGLQGIGHMGQHVEKITVRGIDDHLHLGQLGCTKPLLLKALQQLAAGVWGTPEFPQLSFVFHEFRQLSIEQFQELLGTHRCAVWVPEAGHHHVLDGAFLAVAQLDASLLALGLAAGVVIPVGVLGFRGFRWGQSLPGANRFGFLGFAIPLRITEVVVGLHEVVDGEVLLAVEQASATADDLLELDHRIHRPQQHDVAHVAGIHPRREFLRGGEDGGDRLFVVLDGPQPGVAQFTVVGGDPLAVVGIGAGLELIDQVADRQGMVLGGTEHQGFLALIDLVQKDLHPLLFALFDLDDFVEVGFLVELAGFDLTFHHRVVGRVDVFIEGGGDLLDAEGGEEAVVDALLEGVNEHRIAEVGVGVGVAGAAGGGGEAQLHGGSEVLEDAAPSGFVVGSATVAFIDHDEVEEIGRC